MEPGLKIIYTGEPDHTIVVSNSESVNNLVTQFVNDFNQKNGTIRALDERLIKLERREPNQTLQDADLKSLKEGEVIYASDFIPLDVKFKCGNAGCSKEFFERVNNDTACEFHLKAPVFHEGLKGWGCCKKRVVDFDEFLAIPGCAVGRHKPEEKKIVKPKEGIADIAVVKSGEVEHYTDMRAPTKPKPTKKEKSEKPKERVWEVDTPDAPDAEIAIGTACTHNGCKATYQNDVSRKEVCVYHPGVAEFHEGSKGWVCCKPRMLEFSEFLKINGCVEGLHRFIPDKTKVFVKYDFYQIGSNVFVTFYSKNVKKQESSIKFSPNMVHVSLKLANGDVYNNDIVLAKSIVPSESKYEILSTKVEVRLRKAAPEEWNHFNLGDDSVIMI